MTAKTVSNNPEKEFRLISAEYHTYCQPHWHRARCFPFDIVIHSDNAVYEVKDLTDGIVYPLLANQAVVIRANLPHDIRLYNNAALTWTHYICRISNQDVLLDLDHPLVFNGERAKYLLECCKRMSELTQIDQLDAMLEVQSVITGMSARIVRDAGIRSLAQPSNAVAEAMRYMEQNLNERIHVQDIAKHIGLASSTLSKRFHEEIKKSPVQYITERRISMAMMLLRQDLSIREIAERVGYPDPFYFTKVFKNQTGMSPSEYKKHTQA